MVIGLLGMSYLYTPTLSHLTLYCTTRLDNYYLILGKDYYVHPKTHANLVNISNILNRSIIYVLLWLFLSIITASISIKLHSAYPIFLPLGVIILILVCNFFDLPWSLTTHCEKPGCNGKMEIDGTVIPDTTKVHLVYRCLSCGSVYETTIYRAME